MYFYRVDSSLAVALYVWLPLSCFARLCVLVAPSLSFVFSLFAVPIPFVAHAIAPCHDPHERHPKHHQRCRRRQVLFKTGHPEMATMVFEDAVKDNVDELNSFSKPKLDLHNHTVSTAL